MKAWLPILALLYTLFFTATVLAEKAPLTVATDVWLPNYSVEGGKGLYEDIVRTVFNDHEVSFVYRDYLRTKALVKSGRADLWLGAYKDEEDYALYPNTPMDLDEIVSLRLIKSPSDKLQRSEIQTIWLAGYRYYKYLESIEQPYAEVSDIKAAVRMLLSGKARLLIGDETELTEDLKSLGYALTEFEMKKYDELGLYPAFAKNQGAEALVALWDTRLLEMKRSGELFAIYEKHGLGDEYLFY